MDLALGPVAVADALATEKLAVAFLACLGHYRPSLITIRRKTFAGGAPAPNRNLPWT